MFVIIKARKKCGPLKADFLELISKKKGKPNWNSNIETIVKLGVN